MIPKRGVTFGYFLFCVFLIILIILLLGSLMVVDLRRAADRYGQVGEGVYMYSSLPSNSDVVSFLSERNRPDTQKFLEVL